MAQQRRIKRNPEVRIARPEANGIHAGRLRKQRTCFTLIELLVVVAIIGVLASLLLPALEEAQKKAVRVSCQSDRRQNYMQMSHFAGDHGKLPQFIKDWSEGNEKMTNGKFAGGAYQIFNVLDHSCSDGSYVHAVGIGAMIAMGYVENPDVLFCNTFPTSYSWFEENGGAYHRGVYWGWSEDNMQDTWERMSNRKHDERCWWGNQKYMAISHYLKNDANHVARFSYYADNWKKSGGVSPLVLSCIVHGNFIHKTHDYQGVAGVFYDGHGRWIPKREVFEDMDWIQGGAYSYSFPPTYYLRNASTNKPMQEWARHKAKLVE